VRQGPCSGQAVREGMPIRVIKNALGVYARAGLIEKGLDLLGLVDLKAVSSEEVLGENKVLRFYDLALLDNLAQVYGKASIEYLTKATADDGSRNAANYYLGEAYAVFGSLDRSAEVTSSFLSSDGVPQHSRRRRRPDRQLSCTSRAEKPRQWKGGTNFCSKGSIPLTSSRISSSSAAVLGWNAVRSYRKQPPWPRGERGRNSPASTSPSADTTWARRTTEDHRLYGGGAEQGQQEQDRVQ